MTFLHAKDIDVNIFYKYTLIDAQKQCCQYVKEYTILQIAFEENNLEFIKSLIGFQKTMVNLYLKENYDRDYEPQYLGLLKENLNEKTLLHVACENENFEVGKLLLTKHNSTLIKAINQTIGKIFQIVHYMNFFSK